MNEIVTQISVPADHPSLPGHFPGNPIVPGVVLLDLVYEAIADAHPLELMSIVSTKFLRAVTAGMSIDLHVKLTPGENAGLVKARFTATHGQAPVLEGSFLLTVKDHAR